VEITGQAVMQESNKKSVTTQLCRHDRCANSRYCSIGRLNLLYIWIQGCYDFGTRIARYKSVAIPSKKLACDSCSTSLSHVIRQERQLISSFMTRAMFR